MIDTSRSMLYHLDNLNTESKRVSYQMGSGKVIDKGSDDATLYAKLIDFEDSLRVTENLKLQVNQTQALNDVSDTNMASIKDALDGIKTDLLQSLNSGMDRSDKLAIAMNLRGVRDDLYDRVTTDVGGEYIFSGSNSTVPTLEKDNDFDLNGKIEYKGNGFLREVAVEPGSYRDRGVTGYDVIFYTASKGLAGDSFTFSENERIIDNEGYEWKLNADKTKLQKYDRDGNVFHPLDSNTEISIDSSTDAEEADTTKQSKQATFTIDALPSVPEGRVFEAKHNYFDDLNMIINALEGQSTKLDGTTGGEIDDELVRKTLSNGLEQTSNQFDAANIGHGKLGGRNKVFDTAYEALLAKETHYNILIQENGAADVAKLAMESQALDMTYQALYSTIAKMNEMSLMNYLK